MDLYPMTFSEFLLADGAQNLVDFMNRPKADIEKAQNTFKAELTEKLKTYFLIGGMPEAVNTWTREKDIQKATAVQDEILQSYERDFSKYVSEQEANKISLIWNGIPSQLAKENKKFIYQAIKEGARAREYEGALNWLRDAGLIYKINNVTTPALPLKAYDDLSAFKIYLLDVGLLCRMAGITSEIILEGDQLFREFKGALTENYCLSVLLKSDFNAVRYHSFDRYEVDYLVQYKNRIIPVEVKSSDRSPHVSLTRYNEKYNPELALRLSTSDLRQDDKILNLPLYLAENADHLIDF